MSMTWFKLHHEIIDDIKIRRFTPQEKWAWIVLLSLASKSSDRGKITADNEDLADYCEFNSTQDWLYYRDKLITKGMLEINATGGLTIVHWNDRQAKKPSDDPQRVKERVTKSRAKRKSEALSQSQEDVTRYNAIQAECNADVSPQIRLEENRSDQIRSDQDPFFLEAQEKKIDADCKIEISLPEQKKDLLAFEDPLKDQDPTPPVAPPAPPLRNYAEEMSDRFRDGGNKLKQIKAWQENDLFLRFLHKDLAQKSEYYKNQPYESTKHYIGKSRLSSPEMVLRYEELTDHYQKFLQSQQQRSQQSATQALLELVATPPPAHIRDRFKAS